MQTAKFDQTLIFRWSSGTVNMANTVKNDKFHDADVELYPTTPALLVLGKKNGSLCMFIINTDAWAAFTKHVCNMMAINSTRFQRQLIDCGMKLVGHIFGDTYDRLNTPIQ